jgi:diguanylate cyclase (GGDEF)-like protein
MTPFRKIRGIGAFAAKAGSPPLRRALAAAALLTVCVVLSLPAHALDPSKLIVQYGHRVWLEKDGLPQNSVTAIVQSPRGYMWLATQEGLVRFDGVRFTVFNKRNTPLMSGNYVVTLCRDHAGNLWFSLDSGGVLIERRGTFSEPAAGKALENVRVNAMMEDNRHRMWLGTDRSGLLCLDGAKITRYTAKNGLPGNVVYALYQDGSGTIWIGTNRGLATLHKGRLSQFELPVKGRNWYYALTGDAAGNVWAGSYKGLFRISPDRKVARFTTRDGLPHDTVYAFYDNPENKCLWIGTKDGLCRYMNGHFESYRVEDGLSNRQVLSLTEDREGDLWVGTAYGLNQFRDDKFFSIGRRSGLASGLVDSVLQAKDGSIWIGTDGGGASRWTAKGITNYTQKNGLPGNTVNTLMEDKDGTIWMGLEMGGLVKWKDGRLTRFLPHDKQLVGTGIYCLMRDSKGTLWAGTANGLFRIRNGRARRLGRKDGLSGDEVNCLLEDRNGGIWVGTDSGGLDFYKEGKFKVYTTRQGLANNSVNALYQEPDGTLWIGTMDGVSRFRGGRFSNITQKQGLFSNTVFILIPDKNGRFWMSCNKGVFSVPKDQLDAVADGTADRVSCEAYGRSDGMGSSECNGGMQPSGWRTRGGWLCVATMRGLSVLNPNAIHLNTKPPPVVIEQMLVDGRSVPLSSHVKLEPGRHRIEFRYTALSLVAPEKELFRYRLRGYDPGWVGTSTRREAVYTGLPPGDYTFRVIACNNDGVWNNRGASFTFVQLPHFYETWWFYVVIVLLALGSILGLVRLRLSAARRREAVLKQLVGQRTSLLAKRSRQLRTLNRRLRELSNQDMLTGVANRRRFEAVMDVEWRRAQRTGTPISVLMADIDHFKPFNDAYGHQQGDECLKRVANAMSAQLQRAGDLLARYGGEEFVVVLPGHGGDEAREVAERLRTAVERLEIPTSVSKAGPHLTISIGVASSMPQREELPAKLVEAADQALYKAKGEGRNRVVAGEGDESETPKK